MIDSVVVVSSSQNGLQRQSNIELLRLVSMFMVLVFHASFLSFGFPSKVVVQTNPLPQSLLIIFESLSVICVNVFVLISGWFGIKPKLKSVMSFLFQIFFFLVTCYSVMLIFGKARLTVSGILECFTITPLNWFIKSYLGLYLLCPVLNEFVEHSDRGTYKWVLIAFFVLQTVYGWTNVAEHYNNGYSVISFIGLYLLARYFRKYQPSFVRRKATWYLGIYLLCAFALALLMIVPALTSVPNGIYCFGVSRLVSYICPIVIVESCAFFFLFEKMRIERGGVIINRLAISSYAVYLLHANPNIFRPVYKNTVLLITEKIDSLAAGIVLIFVFLIVVYIIAILIDQLRIWTWRQLWPICGPVANGLKNKLMG